MGQSYEDLVVWKKAMAVVTDVYAATRTFPKEEIFGLTAQIRRAAVSVPSNIAEGQGRLTAKDFRNFLATARGSLQEMKTQLRIAENLGCLSRDQTATLLSLASEVGRMLNALLASLKDRSAPTSN